MANASGKWTGRSYMAFITKIFIRYGRRTKTTTAEKSVFNP